MTKKEIKNLRNLIATEIPQDFLVLKPGEIHVYNAPQTGQDFISVTTRLSILRNPILDRWRMNRALEYIYEHYGEITDQNKEIRFKEARDEPDRLFDLAGKTGSKVHAYARRYFEDWIRIDVPRQSILSLVDRREGEEEKDYAVWSALRALESWVRESGYLPLATELRVWSPRHGIAGTLDDIGVIQDDLVLVDLKTSNEIRDDYHFQVPAYWGMFGELTGRYPNRTLIVRLDKRQGFPEVEEVQDAGKKFEHFLLISQLYDIMQDVHRERIEIGKQRTARI